MRYATLRSVAECNASNSKTATDNSSGGGFQFEGTNPMTKETTDIRIKILSEDATAKSRYSVTMCDLLHTAS